MIEYSANQVYFDYLFRDLKSGFINRLQYAHRINESWGMIDPIFKPSLQRRKDRRTLGEFALGIYDNTVRERFLIDEWLKLINKNVIVKDNGIANDGSLVLDTKGESGRPDYIIIYDDVEYRLEVKFNPCKFKNTFKVCDLKSYAGDDAKILLILGDTRMIGPNGKMIDDVELKLPANLQWCIFGRKTIRKMLSEIPIKNHKEVGFKPSIQLKEKEIKKYLKIREWKKDD